MNDLCKLIKKYSCTIIIALCACIIMMSLYNSGIISESFQISENDTTPTIVLFHANWCGHCKKLIPEWINFEKIYHSTKGINVIKIESEENKSLMKLHDVNGYPTIKYCPNGVYNTSGTVDYNGPRNLAGLVEFHEQYSNVEHFTENLDEESSDEDETGEKNEVQGHVLDNLFTL
jgi:thiol-disulfide isomerase/thioredoxin